MHQAALCTENYDYARLSSISCLPIEHNTKIVLALAEHGTDVTLHIQTLCAKSVPSSESQCLLTTQSIMKELHIKRIVCWSDQHAGYFEEKSGSEPFYALEQQEECWKVLSGRYAAATQVNLSFQHIESASTC